MTKEVSKQPVLAECLKQYSGVLGNLNRTFLSIAGLLTEIVSKHSKSSSQSALEASWRRVLDPCTPLLFDLYHYLEQNEYFLLVPEHAPGPSSQVLPGSRVRHPCYSKKLFVRNI